MKIPYLLLLGLVWASHPHNLWAEDNGASLERWRNPRDGMEFVRIPPGSIDVFQVIDGTNLPLRVEFKAPFWLGRTEVTVRQFEKFVRATGYRTVPEREGSPWTWRSPGFKQSREHPVVFVAFEDALKYSEWAGSDLPTEAEWLYACRAGSSQRYYWGDDFDGRYAWYRGNTRALGPRPVGRKRPNPWGLYDLVGNAREYCRVGPTGWWPRGSSWARCESYLTRQGTRAENLMAEGLELRLQVFEAAPQYPPYPYDDDRGFRCIIRAPQTAAGTR